jgi:hypothetical protein
MITINTNVRIILNRVTKNKGKSLILMIPSKIIEIEKVGLGPNISKLENFFQAFVRDSKHYIRGWSIAVTSPN